MKKFLSLLLVALMLVSLASTSLAEVITESEISPEDAAIIA